MVRGLGRSHLSPDGGGFTRAAVDRLAAGGYDLAHFAPEQNPRVELPCPVAIGAVFMIIKRHFRYAFSKPPLQFGADFLFLLR